MIFAEHVKNKLSSLIHEMATAPWLFSKIQKLIFHGTENLILYLQFNFFFLWKVEA
ncbi:MAG: hypothetical protein ACLROG_07000 [Coprococcus phoceensis]